MVRRSPRPRPRLPSRDDAFPGEGRPGRLQHGRSALQSPGGRPWRAVYVECEPPRRPAAGSRDRRVDGEPPGYGGLRPGTPVRFAAAWIPRPRLAAASRAEW